METIVAAVIGGLATIIAALIALVARQAEVIRHRSDESYATNKSINTTKKDKMGWIGVMILANTFTAISFYVIGGITFPDEDRSKVRGSLLSSQYLPSPRFPKTDGEKLTFPEQNDASIWGISLFLDATKAQEPVILPLDRTIEGRLWYKDKNGRESLTTQFK